MRISDWSSDVCSSDLLYGGATDPKPMTPIWVMLLAMRYLLRSKSCWKPSARSEAASPYRDLMLAVRADEARWCAMLSGQLKRLGGTPSRKTGGFYAKALAISGPLYRPAFLNRGKGRIVRQHRTR